MPKYGGKIKSKNIFNFFQKNVTKYVSHTFCYQKGINLTIIHAQQKQLNDVYDRYADMLYHLALSHTQSKEDAEDVIQEGFCKYYVKAPEFTDDTHEKAWFIRVTVNQCHDLLRHRKLRSYTPLHEIGEIARATDIHDETALDVMHLLSFLPEKLRIVVILHYLEGLSVEETAAALRLGKSAVKMRLSRARALLQDKIIKEDGHV